MTDKVLHSAAGLGSYVTAIIAIMLGCTFWVILMPLALALVKEGYDKLGGGKFDFEEVLATINPFIVVDWYFKRQRN